MIQDFSDRHVVISGGTGALGLDVLALFLERGAHCWVPCLEEAPTNLNLEGDDRVHFVENLDLSQEKMVADFYSSMPSLWASVHVAGGFAMSPVADTSLADFERMWRMNTVSSFLCCQAAVKRMREGNDGGRIVNVAARPAVDPAGGMLAYTTSKAGVASLTECLAREVASEGILVNAILPAIMDTPGNRTAMPDADHSQWPKTADIAQTLAFLASPSNTVTTGALMPVYGRLI